MELFLEIIIVGLVLSADSFSAAVAMGHRPFSNRDAVKFALSSGGAEALMTLLGALAGLKIISQFSAVDHWIAFLLLGFVAFHMAHEGIMALKNKEVQEEQLEFHSFKKILLVSFATSLDAFGVGISLGIAHKPIYLFSLSIAFWAFTTTLIGLFLAKKLSEKFGPIMNLVGAIVLGYLAIQALKL